MNFSIDQIIEITNGHCKQKGNSAKNIKFFATDSRKIRRADESIFVPLKTSSRDGHDYIVKAYEKSIRCFLISNKEYKLEQFPEATFIYVDDTLIAMQSLAVAHRTQFDIPIIGITGSNGKTIVKEWLANLMSNFKQVVKNPKSYNSQIGVAIALNQMNATHQLGVFEAGISQPGEMERLQKMIDPRVGLFTMLGEAHSANFVDKREKIREKLLLFTKVEKLFFCSQHENITKEIKEFLLPQNPTLALKSWGINEGDILRILSIDKKVRTTTISAVYAGKELSLNIPYSDAAYIEDALHCWLVMLDVGYNHEEFASLFMNLPPVKMRLELIKGIQSCTIINDSYSSDFASLQIALDFLSEQKQHKKHSIIISDIAQQSNNDKVYDDVLQLLKDKPLHRIVLIGEDLSMREEHFSDALKATVSSYLDAKSFLATADISVFQNEAILIKGARKFTLERIVNRLEEHIHRTVLNINLSALNNNVSVFKKRLKKDAKVMAMVKAFSYGSGAYEVASALEHYGIDYLAVAYVDEGILLRKKGIELPILVLNPEVSSLDAMLHYDLEPEVYSISLLQQFIAQLKTSSQKLKVHIKLDTGMHRLGIEEKDLDLFLEQLVEAKCFDVQSAFSHLVGSGSAEHEAFTMQQLSLFKKMSAVVENKLGHTVIKHISNSSGAIQDEALQLDMVRLGIGLYGIDSNNDIQKELQQIGRLKTSISQIKNIPKSETVGYSRAGVLSKDSRIATINIGYADGYSRKFGNGIGHVLIQGKLAPVVGNVCMDMTMVDVTDIADAAEGSEVIVFGPELAVNKLAAWVDTIPYEIIAGISQRVKRVFYKE